MLASYAEDFRPSSGADRRMAFPDPGNATGGVASTPQPTAPQGGDAPVPPPLPTQSLAELLELDASPPFVLPSFSQQLDLLVGGGGVAAGSVVEFCGAPGTGKTQLCLQFAVAASLPTAFGGPGGSVIIVDTEGSFVPGRLREVAAAASSHVQLVANHQGHDSDDADELRNAAAGYTVDHIMRQTLIERVVDVRGLVAFVTALPSILQVRNDVRAVIIDSIAFPFRAAEDAVAAPDESTASFSGGRGTAAAANSTAHWDAAARRARLQLYCARELHRLAKERHLAVILTNQVQQSRVARTGETKVVPALGDAWQHAVGNRFVVTVEPSAVSRAAISSQSGAAVNIIRRITTVKSSRGLPGDACHIAIGAAGIRDAPAAAF